MDREKEEGSSGNELRRDRAEKSVGGLPRSVALPLLLFAVALMLYGAAASPGSARHASWGAGAAVVAMISAADALRTRRPLNVVVALGMSALSTYWFLALLGVIEPSSEPLPRGGPLPWPLAVFFAAIGVLVLYGLIVGSKKQRQDEWDRHVADRATRLAFIATLVASTLYGMAELAGAPRVPLVLVPLFGGVTWVVGYVFLAKKLT